MERPMNLIHKLALATLAGVALGAAAIQSIHAQAKAPVYVINEIDVSDPTGFKTYADRQGDLIASFGSHFLARGGKTETISGAAPHQRTTIYVFDNMDKMQAWRDPPQQKHLSALLAKASSFRSRAVERLANCSPAHIPAH